MSIYYIIFGILAFLSIFEFFIHNKKKGIVYFIIAFLVVFLGIRYNVGNDFEAYYFNYIEIQKGNDVVAKEPLYVLVNILSPNYQCVVIFFASITLFYLYKFIVYFNYRYIISAILIYFSVFLINYNVHIFRQGLSIALILWGYKFLYEQNKIKFAIIVIIASLFHLSALFVLPFTFLIHKEISIKIQIIIFILALIIGYNAKELVSIYYSIVTNIPLLNKYTKFYRQEEVVSYQFSLGMLVDFIILFLFMRKYKFLKGKHLFIYKIFYISVILSLVLMIEPTSLRLNYYFRTVLIVLLPLLYKYYNKGSILIFIFILSISLGYLYKTFNSISEYGRTHRNLFYKTIITKDD